MMFKLIQLMTFIISIGFLIGCENLLEGIPGPVISEWKQHNFDDIDIYEWREVAGFTIHEAKKLRDAGYTVNGAFNARENYQLTIDQAVEWKLAGFSLEATKKWIDQGLSLAEAKIERDQSMKSKENTIEKNGSIQPINPPTSSQVPKGFVFIPAGSFLMGSSSGRDIERPLHRVRISKGFYLSDHEVTLGEYSQFKPDIKVFSCLRDDCPVSRIPWNDAQAYIKWLNQKAGRTAYRLPTEAEWEYAARAWTETKYVCGDDESCLNDHAWYKENADNRHLKKIGKAPLITQNTEDKKYAHRLFVASKKSWYSEWLKLGGPRPIKSKRPNRWGLYDIYGNVWEWTSDFLGPYSKGSLVDPQGQNSSDKRVLRGGGWQSRIPLMSSTYRIGRSPYAYPLSAGFRLIWIP